MTWASHLKYMQAKSYRNHLATDLTLPWKKNSLGDTGAEAKLTSALACIKISLLSDRSRCKHKNDQTGPMSLRISQNYSCKLADQLSGLLATIIFIFLQISPATCISLQAQCTMFSEIAGFHKAWSDNWHTRWSVLNSSVLVSTVHNLFNSLFRLKW